MPKNETYEYGNNSEFVFDVLRPESPAVEVGEAERVIINHHNYERALDDINYTLRVHEDDKTGQQFEIAVANMNATEDTVDLELSTFSSSITNNIGNAIEFAEHAALYPNRRRVYVASFGNGGTSYWTPREQEYITETGRFVGPYGRALPTVAALQRVLRKSDLVVERLSANSAGGAHITSLMTSLPEGQVSRAYLKSRPNISNHKMGLAWGMNLMAHEQIDERRYKRYSQDEWRMTEEIMDNARQTLAATYEDDEGEWSAAAAATTGLKKLWTDMKAFSRGGEAHDHPAVFDTLAALKRQPEAKLTYHFPARDKLYTNLRRDVSTFLGGLVAQTVLKPGQVEALIVPGTHHDHSQYPSLRWSIEKYAFNR